MYPQPETVAVATPITINANLQAVPASASISISANGGATFNAAKACNLTFSPSCPFQGASGNVLSLSQGNNNESLISGVTQQKYTYTIAAASSEIGPPDTEQFDVVVGS